MSGTRVVMDKDGNLHFVKESESLVEVAKEINQNK